MIDGGDTLIEALRDLERRASRIRSTLAPDQGLRLAATSDTPTFASYAEAMLNGRQRLSRHVPGGFFGDPALDLLLDLYIAAERGETRCLRAAAETARVPAGTALRWIDTLAQAGLIEREGGGAAGRVTLRLSARARSGLRAWLAEMSSIPLRRELAE